VLAVAVVELVTNARIEPKGAAIPCEILLALALLWRRVTPLAVVTAVAVVQVVEAAAGVPLQEPIVPLLASVIAIYALITTSRPAQAVAGALISLLAVTIETILQHKGFANFAFAAVFTVGAVLVGRTVSYQSRHAARLERQAVTLERTAEENARKAAQAAEHERARIARELHDVIAHSLSLMVVQAGAAERMLAKDVHRARDALVAVQATGREALADMARVVGVLREDHAEAGLAPQPGLSDLPRLVEDARRDGLEAQLHIDVPEQPVPLGPALSLYRIVQEALTNVRKHTSGATTSVRVTYCSGTIVASIHNRGGTGGSQQLPSSGYGLVGMRERVALYGGTLEAGPDGDGGYLVRACIPVGPA
jgi:signal transduction histidine kinase